MEVKTYKLLPLSEAEKQFAFAEENINIVYCFLSEYGCQFTNDVALIIGYLKAVQAYHRVKQVRENHQFFYVAWQAMKDATMGGTFR